MAKQTKPTKQQVAQAKARAGGNNPIKVTDAGLKKLGKVAVTAASLLPAGRAVKAVSAAKKASLIAKSAKGAKKENQKIATEVIQSRSVRTRPADEAARKARNVDSASKTAKAKSGAAAKEGAKKTEKFYKDSSPYLGNQTVRVKSGNAEPYKITGGAGSTARRAGEVIKRTKKK